MIVSDHARKRIKERILSRDIDLDSLDSSIYPPMWANLRRESQEGMRWIKFKDIDGIECAALVRKEDYDVMVTVIKRDVP